jgi:hypothetical protein
VHNKILLVGYVIDDIKELEVNIQETTDPELLLQYKQEMRALVDELNEVSQRCLQLIDIYVEECKEKNIPMLLDYLRVRNELKKAVK